MKKLLIILAMLFVSIAGLSAQEVKRTGNTFEAVQTTSETDVQTPYTWKEKDGQVYPIYLSKKGSLYIKKVSKQTGKEYKKYLPKEVQTKIKQELGM